MQQTGMKPAEMPLKIQPAVIPPPRPASNSPTAFDNNPELTVLPCDTAVDVTPEGVWIKVVSPNPGAFDHNSALHKASNNAHKFGLMGSMFIKNQSGVLPCLPTPPHDCLAEVCVGCWYRQDVLVGGNA
jgi:hypothetical protein